jgi:hypothetical protein
VKKIGGLLLALWAWYFVGAEALASPAHADKAREALARFKAQKNSGWAYKPVVEPAIPTVTNTAWPLRNLDFFVLREMELAGLSPSENAERGAFIRRATLDAWGMVPSPEEVEAFRKDKSSAAYENLVDRLLDSPRFGERQARRWLDLARYADSAGFESDDDRMNMWRYRDYVIKSFNDDKPFDHFILEQIAGDELWPDSYEARIATGYLAGYLDSGGFRDLIKRKYEIENDMVSLVGESLLAASIGCAQCHDHKFDNISQKDYFRFQAFFANAIAFEELPVEPANQTQWDEEYQRQNGEWEAATQDIRAKQKAILDQVREAGLAWRRERYFPDARESLAKAPDELTPLDRWVHHRAEFVEVEAQIMRYLRHSADENDSAYKPENIPLWQAYQTLSDELKQFDHMKPARRIPYYTAMMDLGKTAPETYVRFGGIHERPLEAVDPGIPDLWAGQFEPDIIPREGSTGRRAALASWIASDQNPLTARVYVNRVWAQLFESGIAENVAEFGKAGPKPTNPELLDHLAFQFMQNGWSVKSLFRDILLSRTYRQSSMARPDVIAQDPQNHLLAVFPRKRLEAEQVRDSLLRVSGRLDGTMGGPPVFPKMPESIVKNNKFWDAKAPDDESYRRSIYTFVRRSLPFAMTASFDPAEPSSIHHQRDVSTTALQALALMNSEEVFELSSALAGRVINEKGLSGKPHIDYLYQLLYARTPSSKERRMIQAFLDNQVDIIKSGSWSGTYTIRVPTNVKRHGTDPALASAFLDLVHTLVSSNEFIYRY